MAAIGKERELRLHWQRVRELMLQEADVAAVTWRVQLAVLKDAKLDVTALSEPIERMMNEPPSGLLSNAKFNVMEEDEQPTELKESNEQTDSDKEERRRQEELQQAEARAAAEEERRRQEALQSELQQSEAGGERGCCRREESLLFRFARTAIVAALGRASCSSSSRFEPTRLLRKLTPVTLPPGRLSFATRPSLTGSPPVAKMIGTVVVVAFAARAALWFATIKTI